MAHVLSNDEKTAQRTQGQWSKILLAVPEYHVKFAARLASVPSSTDLVSQLSFNSGVGDISDVLPDMTLYVGTTQGGYELGMCRIRKNALTDCIDTGILYIGATSEIDWQSNAYLTVVDDYSLWTKPLRVVSEETYMDWDVDYDDQHDDFDPVPAMGGHRVAKLTGASVDVVLGSSADVPAWVLGSTISSREWSISGASSIESPNEPNPVATFTQAGTYLAYCEFTAANGKTFTGVVYVIIHDDDHPLISDFRISSGSYSADSGSFDVTLFNPTDADTLRKRSLVILVSEDHAETNAHTLPHPIEGAENIIAFGWIADIQSERTSQMDSVSFSVQSGAYWLQQIRDFPSGLVLTAGDAQAWNQMPSLNVQRAAWHFLHWRSTATRVMDVQITDDGRLTDMFETARETLWDRLKQIATPTIYAIPIVDQWGRLFMEIEPQMEAEADRDFPVVMTLEKQDIEGGIQWVRRDVKALSMFLFSGMKFDISGSASSYYSMSPGHVYGRHGREEPLEGYLVTGQAKSNSMCGCYFGWQNADPYNLSIDFVHSFRMIAAAPRQYYAFTLSAQDDPRGLGFSGNIIPREVRFASDPQTGFIRYSVSFEPEAEPGLAVDGDVPTMEDVDFSSDFDFGGFDLPDLPILDIPPDIINENHPTTILIASTKGVFYTEEFNEDSPEWLAMNNGIDELDIGELSDLVITPNGTLYMLASGSDLLGYDKVLCADGLGGEWREVFSTSEYPQSGSRISGIGINPYKMDEIAVWGGRPWSFPTDGNTGEGRLAIGGRSGLSVISGSAVEYYRGRQGKVVYASGGWTVLALQGTSILGSFASPYLLKFSAAGSFISGTDITENAGRGDTPQFGLGIAATNRVLNWDDSGYAGYGDIEGTTLTWKTGIDMNGRRGMSFSPDGTYAMGSTGGLNTPYRTTDGGTTWESVAAAIAVGSDVWENCRDNNRWVFGGGLTIKLTLDQGETSAIDKSGNLGEIAPLLDITDIRYIA